MRSAIRKRQGTLETHTHTNPYIRHIYIYTQAPVRWDLWIHKTVKRKINAHICTSIVFVCLQSCCCTQLKVPVDTLKCVCVCMPVWECVGVCECVHVCICAHLGVCTLGCVCACRHVCMRVCVCLCLCAFVSMCLHVSMWFFVHACLWVCVWVCGCVCGWMLAMTIATGLCCSAWPLHLSPRQCCDEVHSA